MGGAFDPVHYGHLRTALEIREHLQAASVRLIPSANPPHRPPHVGGNEQRLQMLQAVAAITPWFDIDDRELRRDGPSFTVVTLAELRAECGDRSLCIILGMDAFLGLPDWHRWEELCELAHVVVAHRPGWIPPVDGELGELLAQRATNDPEKLLRLPAGCILVQEVTQLEISSSAVRAILAAGHEPRYLLPDAVLEIIDSTECYKTAGA